MEQEGVFPAYIHTFLILTLRLHSTRRHQSLQMTQHYSGVCTASLTMSAYVEITPLSYLLVSILEFDIPLLLLFAF